MLLNRVLLRRQTLGNPGTLPVVSGRVYRPCTNRSRNFATVDFGAKYLSVTVLTSTFRLPKVRAS